jgi:hypothetical protein
MVDALRRFRRQYPSFDPTAVRIEDVNSLLQPYVVEGLGTSPVATSLDRMGTVCLARQLEGMQRPAPVARAFRQQLLSLLSRSGA